MEILLKSTEVRQNAKNNAVYLNRPNLYIGFHGCDKSVGEKLLFSPNKIQISQNNYEWLGHGFYVWENNSERALDWAEHHPKIKNPFVIGVVYTLGFCLDLTDKHYIDLLANAYEEFVSDMKLVGKSLPKNQDVRSDIVKDELLRKLDCAVIQHLHSVNKLDDVYDSVRGAFSEGLPAYEGAKICAKTHIQVCLRNMDCVKGFFLPRQPMR